MISVKRQWVQAPIWAVWFQRDEGGVEVRNGELLLSVLLEMMKVLEMGSGKR